MLLEKVPPSGGSLEIGNGCVEGVRGLEKEGSPFGGIPRNWKQENCVLYPTRDLEVPPSGGSLEIGNCGWEVPVISVFYQVPPSGGSLEIGNDDHRVLRNVIAGVQFPLRGDP